MLLRKKVFVKSEKWKVNKKYQCCLVKKEVSVSSLLTSTPDFMKLKIVNYKNLFSGSYMKHVLQTYIIDSNEALDIKLGKC